MVEAEGENFASNCKQIDVHDLFLAQIKSELKRRGFSVKGKKAALTHRLINVLKLESKSSIAHASPFASGNAISGGPTEAVSLNNKLCMSTVASAMVQKSSNSQYEDFSVQQGDIVLLRKKEKILKMDVDARAQLQVVCEMSTSPGNNGIKMENRIQRLRALRTSCNEIRDEIIAVLPDSEVVEEAQKGIDYQQVIDSTLDIAQEYLFNLQNPNMATSA